MQKRLSPEVAPDPIVLGRARSCCTGFASVLLKHPVGGDVVEAIVAGGDDNRRLPIRRDAPGRGPLVDGIGVCADFLSQRLAGRPSVDQVADGGFIAHDPL